MSTNSLLLLISIILAVESLPDCDYVATDNGLYYPIGGCESDINQEALTISSFKYMCNDNKTIDKYMYNTFDCEGTPNETITNMTELDISSYSCNNIFCDYAIACSFQECNTNENDTECALCSADSYSNLLTQNHTTHCAPYIKDQCLGTEFGYIYECEGGVLSEYYKYSCNGNEQELFDSFGGDSSTCKDENNDDKYVYYTVDCDPFFVAPECNYAEASGHLYPIGACETDRPEPDAAVVSYKYVCNGNSVDKYTYSTVDCDGEPDEIDTNPDIDHYQCRLGLDCSYAVQCKFFDCGDSNECDTCSNAHYQQTSRIFNKHSTFCRPWITEQCYGHSDAFMEMSTCDATVGELSVGYYSAGCGFGIFYDKYGGSNNTCTDDDNDGNYTYYKIDCNPTVTQPQCNYVVTTTYPYRFPIGGCESDITVINDTDSDISSYKFMCDSNTNTPQKYMYDTFGCDGEPDMILSASEITDLDYYQCESIHGDCPYATECKYRDCGKNENDTTCSMCSAANYLDNYKQNHDAICTSYITDECFGGDFKQYGKCSSNTFTDNWYYGEGCEGEGIFAYNETFETGYCDSSFTYHSVDCTMRTTTMYPTTLYPTAEPTTAPFNDSGANIISIFMALIYANIILFTSF